MSCPYFYPVERLDEGLWAVPHRLPLLDAWRGECRASDSAGPAEDDVTRLGCNAGYARGKCSRFPEGARIDAVRFHVAAESGDELRLQYILEEAGWPREQGEMRFSRAAHAFTESPVDDIMSRQALVFMEGYLRRVK